MTVLLLDIWPLFQFHIEFFLFLYPSVSGIQIIQLCVILIDSHVHSDVSFMHSINAHVPQNDLCKKVNLDEIFALTETEGIECLPKN